MCLVKKFNPNSQTHERETEKRSLFMIKNSIYLIKKFIDFYIYFYKSSQKHDVEFLWCDFDAKFTQKSFIIAQIKFSVHVFQHIFLTAKIENIWKIYEIFEKLKIVVNCSNYHKNGTNFLHILEYRRKICTLNLFYFVIESGR